MNSETDIESAAAIAYSASIDKRNYLRSQMGKYGLSVICFGNEGICFDNFESIHPRIILAETDSEDVVWRFIFALNATAARTPLVIVSNRLNIDSFLSKGVQVPFDVVALNDFEAWLAEKMIQMIKYSSSANKDIHKNGFHALLGRTQAIEQVRSMLPSISDTLDPVLITGERGTGKELLARLIAGMKKRESSIIKIDCSKLKPDMIADAIQTKSMGIEKGSHFANIFLDHLDKLSIPSQAEMLLLIEASRQSGNGSRVGGKGRIRFIASADPKIRWLVQKGQFRKDLFYRLNVIPVAMPPLRERKPDIPLLMDYFVINACTEYKKCIAIPSRKAREICVMHNWPGNVEELKNHMKRIAKTGSEAHLLDHSGIHVQHKSDKFFLNDLAMVGMPKSYEIKDYLHVLNNVSLKGICNEFVARTERRLMRKALETTSWNRKKAAKLLNISYKSMLNKMKAYDII